MKPVCRVCGVRGMNLSCDAIEWRCSLCMAKQEHRCSCELCTYEEEIIEEEIEEEEVEEEVIEVKPLIELGE